MSDFNKLKSIWETRTSEQPLIAPNVSKQPPGILNVPPKVILPPTPNNNDHFAKNTQVQGKKNDQAEVKKSHEVNTEQESPRKSVAQLKNNLEGKIKFGAPGGQPFITSPINSSERNIVKQQNSFHAEKVVQKSTKNTTQTKINNEAQTKIEEQRIKIEYQEKQTNYRSEFDEKMEESTSIIFNGNERMPSFLESKDKLEKMFGKKPQVSLMQLKENTNRQDHLEVVEQVRKREQSFIIINNEKTKGDKLTPEERMEQIMNRIFGESHDQAQSLEGLDDQNSSALNVRAHKKKKNFGDFDDA